MNEDNMNDSNVEEKRSISSRLKRFVSGDYPNIQMRKRFVSGDSIFQVPEVKLDARHPDEEIKKALSYLQQRKKASLLFDDVLKCEDPKLELKGALSKKPHSTKAIQVWIWILRILPMVALLVMMGYFIALITKSENWETDPNSDDETKLERTGNRGIVMSIIASLIITICGGYMFHIGVPEGMVITNFGFVLAPVIGYMLDVGVATDEGWINFFALEGFKLAFECLTQDNFARYVVTFFLDLFISNPLQDVMKRQFRASGIMDVLTDSKHPNKWIKKWDGILGLNFPAILQAMVGFVTFNAYTNQTRFAWAYPAQSVDRDLRIPPGAIMLSTAIAAILYLKFSVNINVQSLSLTLNPLHFYFEQLLYLDGYRFAEELLPDQVCSLSSINILCALQQTVPDPTIFVPSCFSTKLFYVILVMMILYVLNWQDCIEAQVEGEENTELLEWMGVARPAVGLVIFILFVIYGFVYPVYTQLGCCGRCKPKPKIRLTLSEFHQVEEMPTDDEAKPEAKEHPKIEQNGIDEEEVELSIASILDPERQSLNESKKLLSGIKDP